MSAHSRRNGRKKNGDALLRIAVGSGTFEITAGQVAQASCSRTRSSNFFVARTPSYSLSLLPSYSIPT